MCLAPRQAWLATERVPSEYWEEWTPFGSTVHDYGGEYKRRLRFQEPKALPFYKEVLIPCRKCFECVQSYSTNWAVRCSLEAASHKKNCFVTLTYDNEHLQDISVREVQKFLKRLRKSLKGEKVRYFACGEYGEHTGRPHYHIILFGVDFSADRQFLKRDKRGNPIYVSATLSKLWKNGFHSIGALTYDSAKYCAKYMQKFNFEDGKKAFTLQSRKPAIGYNYAMEHSDSISKTGKVYIDGKEYNAPYQFKQWYSKRLDKAFAAVLLDGIKRNVHTFDFVAEKARERRQRVFEKFGFWNIKTKFKKEFAKLQC